MAEKIKIYVGCALTESPKDFKAKVEELKSTLRSRNHTVFDFVGLVAGTPKDVYEWDIGHCVKGCDAFIAVCDYPAIGLGYEISEAARLKKPVLLLAHGESRVTRLLHGAAEVKSNVRLERYQDLKKDGLATVDEWLESLKLA